MSTSDRLNIMKYLIILVMSAVSFTIGCATIVQPGPDIVAINSSPSRAKIWLDGKLVGRTPAIIPIDRASEGVFRLEVEGYEPITIDRDKVAAGWFFGNLLLGGVIGIAVDLITHNQGKYSEEPIYAKLTPITKKNNHNNSANILLKKKRSPAAQPIKK